MVVDVGELVATISVVPVANVDEKWEEEEDEDGTSGTVLLLLLLLLLLLSVTGEGKIRMEERDIGAGAGVSFKTSCGSESREGGQGQERGGAGRGWNSVWLPVLLLEAARGAIGKEAGEGERLEITGERESGGCKSFSSCL